MRFAVHRPGIPEASPRSHGVPRRDVDGRVHISVAGETAGNAPEEGLALTRVPVHLPARRAPLARVVRLDLLHPPGRLVRQPARQQPPTRPQDPPVQPGLGPDIPAGITPGAFRDQRNLTHPALGTQTWPTFRDTRRTSHCRPRRPTMRNPSCRLALRHDGRPAGLAGSRNAVMAWVKSRRACCSTARFQRYRAWPQWSCNTACRAGLGNNRYLDIRTHYRMPLTFPGR